MTPISRLDDYRSTGELMACVGRFVDRAQEMVEYQISHFRGIVEERKALEARERLRPVEREERAPGSAA